MIRLPLKNLAAFAIALGAVAIGSAAHARGDVSGDDHRHRAVPPATVVMVPHRTVTKPHALPLPVPAPAPHLHLHRDARWRDSDRDGVPNRYDRDSRFHDARYARLHGPRGDFDRDGVPNRFDRAPRNPWRY